MVFQKQSKKKIDISNREQVEQMLRHLGMIAERAEEGIVVVDLKGVLHFVNTAWAVMHGYRNSSELLGKQVSAFYKEVETRTKVTALIEESKRKGTCIGQAEHMRRDKTTFPTRLKMTALKDEKGKASGIMVFATDITQRKGLEQKLSEITRRDGEFKEQIEQLRHKVTEHEQAEEQLKQQAGQLTAANEALEQKIAKHKQTEDELKQLGERLLPRVEQQGTELTAVGKRLEQEIAGRKKAEDELKQLRDQLERQGVELTTSNKQLEQEIARREGAEEELKQLRNQLQQRVEQQTAELTAVNEQLRREMSERKEAGDDLKHLREQLEQCVEEISSEVAAANKQIQRAAMERRRAGEVSDEDADADEHGAADEEIELLNPDKLKTLSELAKRLK